MKTNVFISWLVSSTYDFFAMTLGETIHLIVQDKIKKKAKFRKKMRERLRPTSKNLLKLRLMFLLPVLALTISTFSAFVALSNSLYDNLRPHIPKVYPLKNFTSRNQTVSKLPPYIEVIRSLGSDLTIDTISMGNLKSEQNRLLLTTQKETWVTALPGARWFFAATEDVCFPECISQTENVTMVERHHVCNVLPERKVPIDGDRPSFWTAGRPAKLKSHVNKTVGWWCAQKRAAKAMEIMFDIYRSADQNERFPDWLLLVDDDTWVNPYYLPKVLRRLDKENIPMAASPSIIPMAASPSLMHATTNSPIFFGGAGIAINGKLLKAIVRPARCHYGNEPKVVCQRMASAGFLKRLQFLDGMSPMDLVMDLLKRRVSCLHSDWWQSLLVYLAGYKLKKTNCKKCFGDELTPNMKHMDVYALHMVGTCGPTMLSCHRMTQERMKEMTELAIKCSKSYFKPDAICKKLTEGIPTVDIKNKERVRLDVILAEYKKTTKQ
jgi:hypothetical protein